MHVGSFTPLQLFSFDSASCFPHQPQLQPYQQQQPHPRPHQQPDHSNRNLVTLCQHRCQCLSRTQTQTSSRLDSFICRSRKPGFGRDSGRGVRSSASSARRLGRRDLYPLVSVMGCSESCFKISFTFRSLGVVFYVCMIRVHPWGFQCHIVTLVSEQGEKR